MSYYKRALTCPEFRISCRAGCGARGMAGVRRILSLCTPAGPSTHFSCTTCCHACANGSEGAHGGGAGAAGAGGGLFWRMCTRRNWMRHLIVALDSLSSLSTALFTPRRPRVGRRVQTLHGQGRRVGATICFRRFMELWIGVGGAGVGVATLDP